MNGKLLLPYNEEFFRVERIRGSTTQGGVKVYYGDLLVCDFGDDYDIDSHGQWVSRHSDSFFLNGPNGAKAQLAKCLEKIANQIRDTIDG